MTTPVEIIELHDALLRRAFVDYTERTMKIDFEYFASTEDSNRKALSICFEGVDSISQISSLDRLKKNAFAGNVNYWLPSEKDGGTTYIYLADGCIAIKADQVYVEA